MNMSKLAFYLSVLVFSLSAEGQYESVYDNYKWFSLEAQYVQFNDIVQSPNNPTLALDSTANANLNLRFYRALSVVLSHGSSTSWSYSGLGLKVDLPGLFFVAGRPSDLTKKNKKQLWNSTMSFSKLIATADGSTESFICDRMGFGLDRFVAGGFYINAELNIFSYQGNQFLAPGIGVGFEL